MSATPTALSSEVTSHVLRLHECPDFTLYEVSCGCGDTVALCCTACNEPILLALRPGTFCDHARLLAEDE